MGSKIVWKNHLGIGSHGKNSDTFSNIITVTAPLIAALDQRLNLNRGRMYTQNKSKQSNSKQWLSNPSRGAGIMKFGRPTFGYFIQFFTGHGWLRPHRSKIDDVSSQCRFCNSAIEDPEHLWSSCRSFDGIRHAIHQQCKQEYSIVSFSKPFVWSVTQLLLFFQDPKMVELLIGPWSQQNPL